MVYEFVWELKGRHLVLSCEEMMEVMMGSTGFRLTKRKKITASGGEFCQILLSEFDFSGFSQ